MESDIIVFGGLFLSKNIRRKVECSPYTLAFFPRTRIYFKWIKLKVGCVMRVRTKRLLKRCFSSTKRKMFWANLANKIPAITLAVPHQGIIMLVLDKETIFPHEWGFLRFNTASKSTTIKPVSLPLSWRSLKQNHLWPELEWELFKW